MKRERRLVGVAVANEDCNWKLRSDISLPSVFFRVYFQYQHSQVYRTMSSVWLTRRRLNTLEDLYERKEEVGEGSYGKVWHCVNRETKLDCAVKQLSLGNSEEDISQVQMEVEILDSLTHPNVVQFQGIVQVQNTGKVQR